jgi:ferredoxin
MKLTAASGLLLATDVKPGRADTGKSPPPGAVGFLYDATLCIGCKSCMYNCKKYNIETGGALYTEDGRSMIEWEGPEQKWDAPKALSAKTLNVINPDGQSGTGTDVLQIGLEVHERGFHAPDEVLGQ